MIFMLAIMESNAKTIVGKMGRSERGNLFGRLLVGTGGMDSVGIFTADDDGAPTAAPSDVAAPADVADMADMADVADERVGQLFADQYGQLVRMAFLICGNRQGAEDAVVEAFARVLPRHRSGKVDDLGAYLRRAVVNELVTQGRRTTGWRARLPRLAGTASAEASDAPEDEIVGRAVLWQALLQLPVRQRAVLVLRLLEDRSEADTAQQLGVTLGTVKSQQAKALAKLRELLKEDDSDG